MTEMNTDTNLQLFAELQEVFDEEKECEHTFHTAPNQQVFHGGKAEWYAQVACLECHNASGVLAMCDKWVKTAEVIDTQCAMCEAVNPTRFMVKERIK